MSSGIRYHRLEFRDVEAEQFKEILDRANLEHTIIAGRHGRAEIEQFHGPAFSIDRGHYDFPVVARGSFAPGCICIGIVKGGSIPTWINGSSANHGDLQFYYEGADIFYRAGPGASWAGLTVTRERLQAEARRRLGCELSLGDPGAMEHLHIDSKAFDRLTRLIRSLRPESNGIALSRDAEASSELVLGAYVEAIATANRCSTSVIQQRVAHRNEVVRRADAAMRRHIGNNYSSAQFCKCLGMSERNLELYFHEALGVSPKAWFHYLSLHHARTMLRRNAKERGSVTKAALDCGFEHFGRFSEAYRELFGERPSDTLRSSAVAAPPKQSGGTFW
jgi:AraC-like DNA-binding protein